jgi:class 3 adenylate cyclase/tetratricopeptide (TPR) repeat protein
MQVEGSLAFVDISGFTKLTERLARKGKVGAEEMSDLLNATFSALLRDAWAEGADLVKWGGDAVLLLFRGSDHAARACRAAFDMRKTLRSEVTQRPTSETVTLRMSVGVHSGDFDFYLVGDPSLHRELLVVGPDASTTALMESIAVAGQVVVSARTALLLPRTTHRPGPEEGTRVLRARPASNQATLPEQRRSSNDAEGQLGQYLPSVLRQQVLAAPGEAEHRSVAVAFVRFSGTDDLARSDGVRGVADALDECVRSVQSAAADHGVTFFETDIDQDGGKIMLVAGAPRSAGRDEERMLRAVRSVMDRAGALQLRIGVNRGDVFAGDFGPAFRRTYSIKGDAVNLAARVMAKAGDGEVLATTATLERSSTRFDTSALEPFVVKGKTQLVNALRVGPILGQRVEQRSSTEFIGRAAELGVLRSALEAASRGTGSQVEIVGEPGIGKSRLVAELLAGVPDVRVLSGVCGEYESSTPYFPFRSLLRSALSLNADAGPEATAERLREVVTTSAPHLVPWLSLLGIPLDLMLPPTREVSDLDEQFRKARLEDSVDELATRVLTSPTVMIFEDAQLMDDASAELLARLAKGAPGRPWLVLITRQELVDGYVPRPDDLLTTVRPQPLRSAEALDLVRAAAAGRPMTHDAMTALMTRSGGNPMFLEELVQTAGRVGSVTDLPESVQGLVTRQIDRLSPLDRTVLRYAAVLGMVADLPVLAQLLSEQRDEVRLDEHLPALRDFLDPHGTNRVRFRHALMRDVAYEGLPYRRRQALHEQVGDTIERSTDDPERAAEVLSLHYFHAGRFDRAWTYSRLAGRRARTKYANAEAIDFFTRAVDSARRFPGIDAREVVAVMEALGDVRELSGMSTAAVEAYRLARRRLTDDPIAVANLLFKEARAFQRLGKVPQSLRILSRAMTTLQGPESAESHASRSHLATRYSWGRLTQGRYRDALQWATLAAREAEDSADKSTLAHAYNGLHSAHHYAGEPEDVPYGRLALLAYEELGDLSGQGHSANNLGVEALDRGQLTEALDFFERASSTFGRLGDEANHANATYNQADVLLRQGNYADAEPLLLDALGIARAVEDEELIALVLRETGRVCVGLGRFAEAEHYLVDAREHLTALGLTQELATLEAAMAESQRLKAPVTLDLTAGDAERLSADI